MAYHTGGVEPGYTWEKPLAERGYISEETVGFRPYDPEASAFTLFSGAAKWEGHGSSTKHVQKNVVIDVLVQSGYREISHSQ